MIEDDSGATPAGTRQLDCWKEIAAYLGRQVRTVQRWEKEESLPVHRLVHKKRGSVYAFPAELDAWRESHHSQLQAETVAEADSQTPAADPDGRSDGDVGSSPGPFPERLAATVTAPPPQRPGTPRRVLWLGVGGLALCLLLGATVWQRHHIRAVAPTSTSAPAAGRLFAAASSEGGRPLYVSVGLHPERAIMTPAGNEVYVSNSRSNSVSVISTATGTVTHTLAAGRDPIALAVSPDGSRVYVGDTESENVQIIDTASKRLRAVPTGGNVSDLALSPDGAQLYAALLYGGLERIDTASLRVTRIATPACPAFLAMAPNGKHLYVTYQCGGPGGSAGNDAIAVFDPLGGGFERITGLGMVGSPIMVSPDGTEVWTGGGDACSAPQYNHHGCSLVPGSVIHVLDTADRRLIRSLPIPAAQGEAGLAFFPDGGRVLVGGIQLKVVDATRFTTLEAIPLDGSGEAAFSHDGTRAYVPMRQTSQVAIFRATAKACAPASTDLVAWWPGDGTPADAWGMLDGAAEPGVQFSPARVGQGFTFSGRGGLVDFGHDAQLGGAWSTRAFGLWIKMAAPGSAPADQRDATILDKMAPDGHNGWRLLRTPDHRVALCFGGGTRDGCAPGSPTRIEGSTRLPAGAWTYVAASGDHSDVTLTLDGRVEAHRRLDLRHSQMAAAHLLLGGNASRTSFFAGVADELVLYDRPLASADLAALMRMPQCVAASR